MTASKIGKKWTYERRETLSCLLKDGYNVIYIASHKLIPFSRQSIYEEIQRGTTEEDYLKRKYLKYDPRKAMLCDVQNLVGEEGIKAIYEYMKEYDGERKESLARDIRK